MAGSEGWRRGSAPPLPDEVAFPVIQKRVLTSGNFPGGWAPSAIPFWLSCTATTAPPDRFPSGHVLDQGSACGANGLASALGSASGRSAPDGVPPTQDAYVSFSLRYSALIGS